MAAAIFILSQVASTVFSIDTHTSIFGYYGRFNGGLLSILAYFILYLVFTARFKKDHIKLIIKASLASSTVVIIWGLLAKVGFDFTCFVFASQIGNSCWTDQFKPMERMFSTIGQPNWLGSFLLINFFLGLYFYLKANKNRRNLFLISCFLILNFTAILLTRSRSSLLAFVVCFSLFIIFIYFMKQEIFKKILKLSTAFLIAIIVLKTGIPSIDNLLTIKSRFKRDIVKPQSNKDNITDSADIRQIVWQGAYNLGLKYPFFGTGVETFGYSYYRVRPVEHNLTSEWDFIYNKAHNEYLNYFATTGLFGLLTYLAMISFVFILAKRAYEEKDKILTICLLLAYISILITNFFGFSTTVTNLWFYLLPGFFIILLKREEKKDLTSPKFNHAILKTKALISLNVLITFVLLFYLARYYMADINYALAQEYADRDEYVKSYEYLVKAKALKSDHVYDDRLSSVLTNLAFLLADDKTQKKETSALIKLANFYNLASLKASPGNHQYWKTRAQNNFVFYNIEKNENYFKASIDSLRQAQLLAPTDPKIPYLAAIYYSSRSRTEKKDDIKNKFIKLALGRLNLTLKLKPDYLQAVDLVIQIKKSD